MDKDNSDAEKEPTDSELGEEEEKEEEAKDSKSLGDELSDEFQ